MDIDGTLRGHRFMGKKLKINNKKTKQKLRKKR